MQLVRIGDGVAIRLPPEVADRLEFKADEEFDLADLTRRLFDVQRQLEREAALEDLRQFRGYMPADFKFDRDEANAR